MNTCERHGRIRCGECAYIKQLEEERDKLIEVLRWYGRDEQYTIPHVGCSPRVNADRGQRARDILHEIGVTVE